MGSRKPFSKGIIEGCSQVLTDWDDVNLSFSKGYDMIIHAAGMNANDCADYPDLANEFNGKTTERLTKYCALYGCKRFLYLSTVHVYDSPLIGNFDENSETLNKHPYAVSHLLGEKAVLSCNGNTKMQGCVLRISNCFGYPVNFCKEFEGLVLNQFVQDAILLGQIKIKDNYLNRRDFLPITELNKIIIKILKSKIKTPSLFNVSTGISRTLEEVAMEVGHRLSHKIGKNIDIFRESSSGQNYKLRIDNLSLKQLDINVQDSFLDEIDLLIDWLKRNTNTN